MKQTLNCVLLIDDDEPTNFLNRYILQQTEITNNIETAYSASQALQLLEHPKINECSSPDLILLDINMPGLNGWDFIDAYKGLEHKKKNGPVIIMLTTSVNPDDELRAKKIKEIAGFRQKPLTSEAVNDIIARHFK